MTGRSLTSKLQADVGQRVKEARLNLGKTQSDLAREIQTNQGHVSEIERGMINITLETLCQLSMALDCIPIVTLAPKPARKSAPIRSRSK